MKYSEFLTIPVSDDLLLNSVKSFLESKVERANELIEQLSERINDNPLRDATDLSEYRLSYDNGERVFELDTNEFAHHLELDDEEYETTSQGVTITVPIDEVLEQLSNSVKVNRVTTEALSVLQDSGDETPSAILTSFTSRIGLKVGDVSDNIQTMAASYVDILSTKGLSVGDRVKKILQYIGLYNVSTDPSNPDIGIPSCELTDITGANVFQAWWADAPRTILEFKDWLVDTVKKMLKLLEGVLQVVVGSNVFRTIKKFLTTLTLQADSFAYNAGGEDGVTIGDYGFNAKISGLNLNYPWFYGSDKVWTVSKSLVNFFRIAPDYESDVYGLLYYLANKIHSEDYSDLDETKLGSVLLSNQLGTHALPAWIPALDDLTTIGGCALYLYKMLAAKRVGWAIDAQTLPEGYIYHCINYTLNRILDMYHLNDALGITDHLYSNVYTRIDLPGSSLFFWLVGNDVYYTRRVNPLTYYKGYASFNDIEDAIKNGFGISWTLSLPLTLNVNMTKLAAYFEELRSVPDSYAETDVEMMRSIYAANLADAYYLALLNRIDATGIGFNDEIPTLSGYLAFISSVNDAFKVLTGRSEADWTNAFWNLSNSDISNETLADALGAKAGVSNFSVDEGTILVFLPFFKAMKQADMFFPFAHTPYIPIGRYHVITDYELGHVFEVFIEVAIVVIATIVILRIARKLKRKATYYQTMADAKAWKQVENGTFTIEAATIQFKMQKKASRCQLLSNAIFGSITKAIRAVGSSMINATSATVGSFRTKLVGSDGQGQTSDTTIDIIKNLITG